MKFPLSRTETTSAAYTHKLLLALAKSCNLPTIRQSTIDAIADDDLLIISADGDQLQIKHGSAKAQVLLITAPKDEQKWQTPHPQMTELPAKGPAQFQIPQQPLNPSSPPSLRRREITPLPRDPLLPKDQLDALGRPKLNQNQNQNQNQIPQPIGYEMVAGSEENQRIEMEMLPETDEELQAIEETMEEVYQEPDPILPTSPLEEILESQEADQNVLPQSRLSSRRVVLDDMTLFLRETAMNAKANQRAEKTDRILRNRDGLLPFKVRKENPKGQRNR